MKKTFTLIILLFSFNLLFAGTPTIDGVINGSEGWGAPVATADNTAGWSGANARKLYVTFDANFVYFGAEVSSPDWMSWAFILNTKTGGATTDSWSRLVTFNHANKPDYTFRGTFGGYAEYHSWNGTAWADVGTAVAATEYAENITGANANGFIELRVPRSLLANQTPADVQFYITGDNNTHGNFDAVPNDNNATSWNAPGNTTTISNYSTNVTLPVSLLDIKAIKNQSSVKVEWTVANELNITGYELQHANDGVNFKTVSTLASKNSSGVVSYSATHNTPVRGKNQYRLIIKEQGREQVSKVMIVNFGASAKDFIANFQQGSNSLALQINDIEKGQYKLSVINATGQQVQVQTILHDGINKSMTVALKENLSQGIYRVLLQSILSSYVQTLYINQ